MYYMNARLQITQSDYACGYGNKDQGTCTLAYTMSKQIGVVRSDWKFGIINQDGFLCDYSATDNTQETYTLSKYLVLQREIDQLEQP